MHLKILLVTDGNVLLRQRKDCAFTVGAPGIRGAEEWRILQRELRRLRARRDDCAAVPEFEGTAACSRSPETMKRWHLAILCAVMLAAPARAAEPPLYTFSPQPPGTIVQSQLVYLAGEAMHSQWRAVLSKKLLGSENNKPFYQWYLSFYAIDGTVYRLKYRSPDSPVPFSRVTKVQGASLWFPVQDAKIVGTGEFMGPGSQQLVVQSHEAAADCGTARVDVFYFGSAMQAVMTTLSVRNSCDLSASVVHGAHGDSLQLTGPYYAANAPLCCPTKPKVTATLHFNNGSWTQQPQYFKIGSNAR